MEALQDPDEELREEVDSTAVDPQAAKDGKLNTGWPELQKDTAPSAICIPAGRCVQKHIKKIGELLKRFDALQPSQRTTLQAGSWS